MKRLTPILVIVVSLTIGGAILYMLDFMFWPDSLGKGLLLLFLVGPLYFLTEILTLGVVESGQNPATGYKPPTSVFKKAFYYLLGISIYILCVWGIIILVQTFFDPDFFK